MTVSPTAAPLQLPSGWPEGLWSTSPSAPATSTPSSTRVRAPCLQPKGRAGHPIVCRLSAVQHDTHALAPLSRRMRLAPSLRQAAAAHMYSNWRSIHSTVQAKHTAGRTASQITQHHRQRNTHSRKAGTHRHAMHRSRQPQLSSLQPFNVCHSHALAAAGCSRPPNPDPRGSSKRCAAAACFSGQPSCSFSSLRTAAAPSPLPPPAATDRLIRAGETPGSEQHPPGPAWLRPPPQLLLVLGMPSARLSRC